MILENENLVLFTIRVPASLVKAVLSIPTTNRYLCGTFSNYFWGVNQTIVHAYSWIKKNQNAKQSWQLKNQRTAYDKRVDGFSKERGDFSSVDHVFVRIFLFYGLVGIRRLNPVSASCRVRMGGGNDAWNDMRDPCTITMYVYYYKLISKAWVNYPPLSKVITNINKDYLCG